MAGGDLAAPVDGEPHRAQLGAHGGDVLVGPRARVDALLHGRVLGRHAERVPAHRVQHVEAARPLVARHHVAHGVVAHMPHMDAPRGVGEHLQHVVFRAVGIGRDNEGAALLPLRLPAGLALFDVVAFGHGGHGLPEGGRVGPRAAPSRTTPGRCAAGARGRGSGSPDRSRSWAARWHRSSRRPRRRSGGTARRGCRRRGAGG